MLGDFAALQQLLGQLPVAALQRLRHAEQEDAVVVRLAADDHIYSLPDLQTLDIVLVQALEIGGGDHAVAFAADVDEQLGRSDLHDGTFAEVTSAWQIKVQVLFDVLLEEFQVRRCLGCCFGGFRFGGRRLLGQGPPPA